MAGMGDHSIEVTVTNYVKSTLDVQSATVQGGKWMTGGGYTVPAPKDRLGPNTGQVWGVYTDDDTANPTGTVILQGDGGPITITFSNDGNGNSSCTFTPHTPVRTKSKPKENKGDDTSYAVWTCDINPGP